MKSIGLSTQVSLQIWRMLSGQFLFRYFLIRKTGTRSDPPLQSTAFCVCGVKLSASLLTRPISSS